MSNKEVQWIISDTHFNHSFMVDKWIRPDNYQELIINNWKKVIKENDIVYHLWDVIFSRASELRAILKDLPGYKILIMGNHDKNKPSWYLSQWFDEVHEEIFIVDAGYYRILLTHKPTSIDNSSIINVCWHTHDYRKNWIFRHFSSLNNINSKTRIYSAEVENYYPIRLYTIIERDHKSARFIRSKLRTKKMRLYKLIHHCMYYKYKLPTIFKKNLPDNRVSKFIQWSNSILSNKYYYYCYYLFLITYLLILISLILISNFK